jgi:hypothetical protein
MAASASVSAAASLGLDGKGTSKGKEVSEQKRARVQDGDLSRMEEMFSTMMNKMTEEFTGLRTSFSTQEAKFTEFAENMMSFKVDTARRWEHFDSKMTEMEADYQARITSLNEKVGKDLQDMDERLTKKIEDIEGLLAKNARPAAGWLAAPQLDPWAQARHDRPAGSRTRSSSTPAAASDEGFDPLKVWVKGFGRPLLRAKLLEQYEVVMQLLPEEIKQGAKNNIRGPSSLFAIKFADAASAAKAYDILRTSDVDWEDRVSGHSRQIKFYRDQKYEDRTASRTIGRMWEPTKAAITASGKWADGMRLLNSGRRLWLVDQDEPFELFAVNVASKDSISITANATNTLYYGIDASAASSIRAAGLPAQVSA